MKSTEILEFIKENQNLTVKQIIQHLETTIIKKFRNRTEYRTLGLLHREDGPAKEWTDGTQYWYKHNKLHRENGPAIERPNGSKEWFINGKLHREDGPAIERPNGTKCWYIRGKRHRTDGPAIVYSDGSKEWWIKGKQMEELYFSPGLKNVQKHI